MKEDPYREIEEAFVKFRQTLKKYHCYLDLYTSDYKRLCVAQPDLINAFMFLDLTELREIAMEDELGFARSYGG